MASSDEMPPSASTPTIEEMNQLLREYARLAATIPCPQDLETFRAQKIRLLHRIELHLRRGR